MTRGVQLLLLVLLLLAAAPFSRAVEPVYVGQQVCRQCHDASRRNQGSTWYLAAHARAHAALAMPESALIARLSGIDVDPHSSPVCLGCHTTAADSEAWQRDPTFHFEDGIQCEHCHGPGSEYIDPEIMADPKAAMAAGLRYPEPSFCMVCHKEKGSHLAALQVRRFEVEWAKQQIAHPGRGGDPDDPETLTAPTSGGDFAGAMACVACHNQTEAGSIVSSWRRTPHAEAYAVLSTERGRQIAAELGIDGDRRRAEACRRCHVTAAGEPSARLAVGFDPSRGVQCESCHGPAAAHARGETAAALARVTSQTCSQCHDGSTHAGAMDVEHAMAEVNHSHAGLAEAESQAVRYKTPFNLAPSQDGSLLWVACEAPDTVVVVDTAHNRKIDEIAVGQLPHGVCVAPDDSRVYVSNRGSDTVSVIDAARRTVITEILVGDEPHGLVTDAAGTTLYVANAGSYDISVVDLAKGSETKRLAASRGTWDVARSPDGASILVTNNLSRYVAFRDPSLSEVTVVDTGKAQVVDRIEVPEANLLQGVAVAPHGEFALVTLIRTKNLIPMTRVIQGWVITNGLGILWRDGRVDQLLLDEVDDFFPDPTDVVITPDGRWAYISSGGTDTVAVVDIERMISVLEQASDEERATLLPNHMGVPAEFVLRRIPVGINPRGLAVAPDGTKVWVADALDDTVSVIDVARQERIGVIDLGGPRQITLARKGERIFHSAEVTYGGQFSCHSCHPDGGIDGITYDIEPDGIGLNPVDNRTLRGILDTAPFKWTGKNPSLARQCGPRLAVFFTRIDPFTPEQVRALERYICTIPRNPNRYRAIGAELTPAQRRGKAMFERTNTNTGEEIPVANRCITCHPPPYFTNREKVFVGEGSRLDTHAIFDVPHLNNIYETAPYLHDGRADTLEEIWTRFNPKDEHGVTNDMTKDQLNDLVEYLRTL